MNTPVGQVLKVTTEQVPYIYKIPATGTVPKLSMAG